MKDFSRRFPGLSEEQIRIRKKIWEREQEVQKKLFEAQKKKVYRLWDGDDDEGFYADLQYDVIFRGTISDGPIQNSSISFLFEDGRTHSVSSDGAGKFWIPGDFFHGDVKAVGGTDTITGHQFIGEFSIDAEFFQHFTAITPITHVANYVWLNTPTKTPTEAMDLVIGNIHKVTGVSLPSIETYKIFNDDHVKLTYIEEPGARELQIINTIFETYADILGHSYALDRSEIFGRKKEVYNLISKKIMNAIYGNSDFNLLDFHPGPLSNEHQECSCRLVEHTLNNIRSFSHKKGEEICKDLQSLNSLIKSEWSKFVLEMTNHKDTSVQKMWDSLQKKAIDQISVDLTFSMR